MSATASNNSSTPVYIGAHDVEKGRPERIERVVTPGGHPADFSQPAIPQQHRKFGNPVPLGLTSFGCGFFLASAFNLYGSSGKAQGVHTPNVVVPVLILYGGITQSLCGWWELFLGNTFSATIFGSYGAFNLTYRALYLPAFGVITAYQNADGSLRPQLNQAIGLYLMAWMIDPGIHRTGRFTITDGWHSRHAFLALGIWNMAGESGPFSLRPISDSEGHDDARIAGGIFGMLASASTGWTAMAGYWTPDTTFSWIRINPFDLSRGSHRLPQAVDPVTVVPITVDAVEIPQTYPPEEYLVLSRDKKT
ncbi:hypothetical protein EHS25_001802 [Saitozyma podzolica]|uniref:Uncharacterized protein n=1 Tax=Saitozyma podzolica TaxID=1890683 RepID=A0A427YFE7_9TREE|nr:hypothetical protein EHS25_001802 [Saitozyma podzolica]